MPRTYLYKLTSDRGGAPCALPPAPDQPATLTLAICKPAIRRTAEPGDRILGLTSHSLAHSDGYNLNSIIYAAIVREALDARDYFTPDYTHRPDCIYRFHQLNGTAAHTGRSNLHSAPEHILKDLGRYPFYKNGRVLLAHDFRYFGAEAVKIPARLTLLNHAADTLGQGHRVFTDRDPEQREADALFRHLFKRETLYTPTEVDSDAYDHTPRKRTRLAALQAVNPPKKSVIPSGTEGPRRSKC